MRVCDSSAFFERLAGKNPDLSAFILDLTIYEAGNVVLKHHKQIKKIDEKEAASLLRIIANWRNVIYVEADDVKDIYATADSLGLTFYDAAYVYFSKKYGAVLETCDQKLYSKANGICRSDLLR